MVWPSNGWSLASTLACLAILNQYGAVGAQDVIQDDSFFYGLSPPIYPSPKMDGRGDWADAHRQARKFVNQLTLDEKISLTAGVGSNTACVGTISPIERLDFPGMCVTDAGNGVRAVELVSAWPGGIHVAASWNKELARERGQGMGGEYKAKGVNVMLGPVVGPMGRIVTAGRVWEGFSVDPYLAGALVYESVIGTQSIGVGTSTKHYIANEQETLRSPKGKYAAISSNVDDKTMHELYLWPFADAVRAGSTNIMCSYQRVNNSYACQNSKTLNGLLKTELGFQGFVVTDWQAIHSGVGSALAGLDLAMPNDAGFWGANLTQAVKNGTVPESRVTDMASRIMASWYYLGQDKDFPKPGVGMVSDMQSPHTPVDARDPKFKKTLRNGAVEGHVLVKNDGVLPLKKPKILSVFGFSARSTDANSLNVGWALGYAPYDQNGVIYPTDGPVDPSQYRSIAINGTLFTGGGSGAASPGLVSSPMDAINAQAWEDDTYLLWDLTTDSPGVNAASNACLVMVNQYGSEDWDRPALQSDYSNKLIKNVADKCENTIVIIHNGGTALVNPEWYDHENVKAVIYAHIPGQYSGKALVDLIYGRENFSGRLPYSVAKKEEDYGPLLDPDREDGQFEIFPQSNFSEGVMLDYRRFDDLGIEPQFHFGFGLSYTTFNYKNLKIQKTRGANKDTYPTGAVLPGGAKDLWDVLVTVRVDVRNVGGVDGAEVAQLYVAMPGAGKDGNPKKQLRGFEKKMIGKKRKKTFKFDLTRRDLSTWDIVAQKWKLQKGEYSVMVGRHSGDLGLKGTFTI